MPECGIHKLVGDVALRAAGRVLLVRYRDTRRYDGQAGWFLPDDHLRHAEHPEEAARRIALEQAGIELAGPRLAGVESFADGAWHLVFHYAEELPSPVSIVAGDNVAAAEWFALDALPPAEEMAHDGWAAEVLRTVFR